MRKLISMMMAAVFLLSSCEKEEPSFHYDKEYISEVLVEINTGVSVLQKIVNAKVDGRCVVVVEKTESGYVITLDDKSQIVVNDKKHFEKISTPVVGIKEADGKFFWTVTVDGHTGIVEVGGNRLVVSETVPVVKVDDNGFWIIESEGKSVMINDKDGNPVRVNDSEEVFVCDIKETDIDVRFMLFDGTAIIIPKIVEPEKEPEDDKPLGKIESKGFYVVNEDWFGHDNGTINYFLKNGDKYIQNYRVYRAANPGRTLGVTTCFGAVWGDNIYFISKQGNRLVVADAVTLKSKKEIIDLGGDGRSFAGVDDKKAYIGYMGGIKPLNLSDFSLGNAIDGVSGEIGNMCVSYGKLFAVSQSNLYIIDTNTDKVEKTIGGSYNSVVTAKDGSVWVAVSDKFVVYNPETLEIRDVAYPEGAGVGGAWAAWNPGGLCASTQTNTLYWTTGASWLGGGNIVCRYDIDSSTANTSFYTIPNDEAGKKRVFYGAGLRVDPLSDNLVIHSCRSGWGDSYAYNWISIVAGDGNHVSSFAVGNDSEKPVAGNGYYWFPTMPVFEDANKPQILLNHIKLSVNEKVEIDLKDKIIDYDNTFTSIIKKAELIGEEESSQPVVSIDKDKLVVEAGDKDCSCRLKLTAISNGVRVEKDIELVIGK